MRQILIGKQMTDYRNLSHNFLPFCFSAQIVLRQAVANSA